MAGGEEFVCVLFFVAVVACKCGVFLPRSNRNSNLFDYCKLALAMILSIDAGADRLVSTIHHPIVM